MFVSGSLVQTRVGNFTHPPPNVVHILVMFDPCLDIIDDANARVHGTLQILQFPFDVSPKRYVVFHSTAGRDVSGT